MTGNVILLGAGGHAKVVADTLLRTGFRIVACAVETSTVDAFFADIPLISDDDVFSASAEHDARLVNGIGGVGNTSPRKDLFERFKAAGADFQTIRHPSAVVADDARIGEGVQIMAGAVVQPGVMLGANTIINTRASVDHDCDVGAHVHIAPGVTLSGNVSVGDETHLGTACCAIQGVTIGSGSVVGGGALITEDLPAGGRYVGSPARSVGDKNT